jgi:predicted transcriptional regulator
MAETEIVTVRVSKAVADKLKALAKATNRPKNYHAARAVEGYVLQESEFLEKIAEGMADLDARRLIPHAEVIKMLEKWDGRADNLV